MPPKKWYVHNIPAARGLRKLQTATETAMWEELRDRRFRGLKFRRQHAVGQYVLDFFCPALQCAIEIDGGIHDDPVQRVRDAERQAVLEDRGIWFVRIPAERVLDDMRGLLSDLAESLNYERP